MARHPMSSSWPQLTARVSVSGQSSTAHVARRHHRADGSKHDLHRHPVRRRVAAPDETHDTGAHRLWIGIQPQVSRRSHPVPCSAIRFQALIPGNAKRFKVKISEFVRVTRSQGVVGLDGKSTGTNSGSRCSRRGGRHVRGHRPQRWHHSDSMVRPTSRPGRDPASDLTQGQPDVCDARWAERSETRGPGIDYVQMLRAALLTSRN